MFHHSGLGDGREEKLIAIQYQVLIACTTASRSSFGRWSVEICDESGD